ncbi:MAG: UDP-N-acetylglucosamine 1-carboxyvinyltransferase [Chlamydiales bacterium]|nr:UDP-N-acetylglucosamine 1-carboxyvinyltransferase [Chlamydiales bacterium]
MDILNIRGGVPLQGHIKAAGAKNAMTKLLVASLLSDKACKFYNVPNILDVEITVNLCREIGSEITWDRKEKTLEIITRELKTSYIPQKYSGSNRIPILMIGALLGRTDEDIIVPTIGGDLIGSRPVDLHIHALQKLGARIEYREMKKEGAYLAQAHQGLKGAVISLSYPSVGATENTILAAVRAKGTTLIKNAAIEPEIIDLILFLQKLGAHIMVDADRTISIQQAHQFQEVEHTVLTDRNEVASYAMAAVSTKGRIFVEGAEHLHMIAFLNKLREIGGCFTIKQNGIEFFHSGELRGGLHLETDVHPGFMTDWQQPFVVLLTQARGFSVIHETVYENRFGYTHMLKEMGADIELFTQCLGGKECRFASSNHHHSLVVKGPTTLKGHAFSIPDLRAGFAYVMAALLSTETSTISNVEYLDRGYEELVQKLTSLGASISRESLSKKSLTDKKHPLQHLLQPDLVHR